MIGVLGDLHLGRSLYTYDASPHIRETMYRFVDFCRRYNVDCAVQLGDVFDHSTPSESYRKQVVQWLNEFERSKIPLYVLIGNHDATNDPSTGSALASPRIFGWKYVTIVDRPMTVRAPGDHVMTFLPFPSPGIYRTYHDYLQDVWEVMRIPSFITPEHTRYVFAHLMVEGAVYGKQEFVYRGTEYALPDYIIRPKSDMIKVIAGHIHKGQTINDHIHIVGSAQRLRFDETFDEKHFLLIKKKKFVQVIQPALPLVEIKLDIGQGKDLVDTDSVLKYLRHKYFTNCIVKVVSTIDDISSVDWLAVESLLYEKALWVYIAPPEIRRKKVSSKKLSREKDDITIAKQFIKRSIDQKDSRVLAYKCFKKLYQQVIHDS